LASVYLIAIVSSYGAGFAAPVVAAYLYGKGVLDLQLATVVVTALIGAASAASAVYSVKLWNECRLQLIDFAAAVIARSSSTPAADQEERFGAGQIDLRPT
jgi:hypothetical protein